MGPVGFSVLLSLVSYVFAMVHNKNLRQIPFRGRLIQRKDLSFVYLNSLIKLFLLKRSLPLASLQASVQQYEEKNTKIKQLLVKTKKELADSKRAVCEFLSVVFQSLFIEDL